jgi:competence protein ComEC
LSPIAISLLAGEMLSAVGPLSGWAPLALALALGVLSVVRRSRPTGPWLACAGVASLGLWLASRTLEPPDGDCFLPDPEGAEKLWLDADIDDLPTSVETGVRVRATVRVPGHAPERICGSVLLRIVDAPEIAPGDRIHLHASVRRPRNFSNPRSYDYRGGLARRGIWVTGHASGAALVRLDPAPPSRLAFERYRIGRLIDGALPARDAALLRALVIGDETGIPADLWDRVVAAGIAHLLSVSGLHIALVWGLGFTALRFLLARSEWLLLHVHVRALAAVVALPPAGAYAALAGLSVPAARSIAMTGLFVASLTAGREVAPKRILCLAGGAIGIAWPGAPLEISFQLSFASVLALIVATEAWSVRARARGKVALTPSLRERVLLVFLVPAAALVGTAPLVALHFNRLTPVGLFSNPILVPAAGTPATVIGLAGAAASFFSEPLARFTFALAYWPLELLQWGTAAAAALPWASLRVPTPTLVELGLPYVLFALPWTRPSLRRGLAVVAVGTFVLDAAWWVHERWLHADLRVRFLDVGQGDAAVLELPGGRTIVIDGGGFARSRFDVGERVVAPYLWSRKILHLDAIAVTHGDWDHQGGLHFLAREFAPGELWLGAAVAERARLRRLVGAVRSRGGTVRVLGPDDTALVEGPIRIRCLHPPAGEAGSANDSSLVLRLSMGERALLFTGDVGSEAERQIVADSESVATTVLKVPHHGSASSSSEAFLRWARPEVAVFSLAAGNGYGFPHPAVVARYRRLGTRMLRTDRDGSVLVTIAGELVDVRGNGSASLSIFCSGLGALC